MMKAQMVNKLIQKQWLMMGVRMRHSQVNYLLCHHVSVHAVQTYLKDTGFDLGRLKVQVPMLPSVIKTSSQAIKQVTSVRTIVGAVAESDIYKGMLPEIDRLLKLYLTFPVTTATAERSFSSLRRVKTYLRSTMTSCRLNNLFLLYIHQDRTDSLDLYEIAKDFISVNNRRRKYFGNF